MSVPQTEMNREPDEVRHIREFSNFLSPRIGFFQSEMWNAIIAVVSAMLPAVVVASAVIALIFLGWLGMTSLILTDALGTPGPSWPGARTVFIALIGVSYAAFEYRWSRQGKSESLHWSWWVFHLVLISLVTLGIYFGWGRLKASALLDAVPKAGPHPWEWATSIDPTPNGYFSFSPAFSPYLFAGPILWAAVAVLVLVLRLIIMRFRRERAGTMVSIIDRALSRLLGAAFILTAIAALWLAGCWINYTNWGANAPAGGALVSGGAFALLRNWMGRLGPGKKGGVMDMVKPLIPQILAYVAIALWAIFVAALLADWIKNGGSCCRLFAIALGIILFAMFFFDAAQVSMHSFYRNRLSRAYLGASNIDAIVGMRVYAETNRQTDLRWHDDIELCALSPTADEIAADRKRSRKDRVYADMGTGAGSADNPPGPSRVRPLHLICCAANDLGGDHLENLSRGSRSAVLSKFGYAIGDYWKTWKEEKDEKGEDHKTLGLGSAITASAAAFNSNMGSVSMSLGAGVTFLCTALNLRLGLWLPHPLSAKHGVSGFIPGWLFFKEMFGQTKSGLLPPRYENETDRPANQGTGPNQAESNLRTPVAQDVHLSDGAHFENLALYELVRRHCRYIIVSDCGTDPEVTFDDFGNAVRRIREDFGVEIEIDLSPLKPNEAHLSKQHVAVGTISYDPRGDRKDSAILLYFKPALTGDEPCDITQYRTRNKAFPHESTGDQFYDEAQWESYRRLGEHATRSALRFVERDRNSDRLSPEAIFNGARFEWYQSPERREDTVLELTGRLTALEQQLRQEGPRKLVREMYPELRTMDQEETPVGLMTSEEMCATLHFLSQIMQLMEDVWVSCHLDTHFTDPNNLGWMNAFQRWAYTPSFRLWWPLLKSMYGSKFRRFMEEQLDLADEDYPETEGVVTLHPPGDIPKGLALTYWKRRQEKIPTGVRRAFTYDLGLTLQTEPLQTCTVQGGLAFSTLR